MRTDELTVGDKVWITAPPGQGTPNYHLHADVARLYRKIVKRHRPVRIHLIDSQSNPWFVVRETTRGKTLHHYLMLAPDDHNWKPVKKRER